MPIAAAYSDAERPGTRGDFRYGVIRVGIAMSAFWPAIDNTRHYRPGAGAKISTDWDGKKKARPAPRILVGGLLKHNNRLSLPDVPPMRTHLPALFPIR
jgi:hypothetical protein